MFATKLLYYKVGGINEQTVAAGVETFVRLFTNYHYIRFRNNTISLIRIRNVP